MRKIVFSVFTMAALLSYNATNAQRICGSNENFVAQLKNDPVFADNQKRLEQITADFVRKGGSRNLVPQLNEGTPLYTIPVVVHVVYRTTEQNISDAQIQSQIDVLNRDFQLLNTDAGSVPTPFKPLAADCKIQFCLAKRDPNGNPTTGIVRRQTTSTSFSTNDAVKKAANGSVPWDATKYLNIWVCNLSGGVLGYAQFPGGAAATDGVVITYTGFGTTGTATAPFNLGRTATHEVGHWLNLRHIWGDDGTSCTGSDLVDDTPNQADENYGCPSFPTVSCNNGPNGDMWMNYMDYTDDRCMYMFTIGQRDRIYALFQPGGSRASLLTSQGCTPPTATCAVPSPTAGSISQTSATISWPAVANATSYDLQYKTSAAGSFTTVSGLTGTSYNLSSLSASTVYNYQLRTNCASGSSAYSTTASFTTSAAPVCAVPSPTAGNISQTSATISWPAVANATSYDLQYKTSAAGSFTTVGGLTGTSYNLTSLSSSTTYNYQLRTNCASGSSAYSTVANFTTLADAGGCSDIYEPNDAQASAALIPVGTPIKAIISSQTDKDYFSFQNTTNSNNIRVTLSNLPKNYNISLFNPTGGRAGASSNTGTDDEVIIYNTTTRIGTYVIEVVGFNKLFSPDCYTLLVETSATPFVAGGVTCAVPSPTPSGLSQTSATISWLAVSNATSYDLQYKTSAAGSFTTVSGLTSTSYNLTSLSASTVYNYQVRTNCASGSSAYSATASFTTLANAPVCAVPSPTAGSISQTSAAISWAAVPNATSYDLQYKTSAAGSFTTVSGLTGTSYNLTSLSASTVYNYQLRTNCASGSSAYSTTASFTTLANAPVCAVPSPAAGNISQTSATISWTAVPNATSYDLQYKTSAAGSFTTVSGLTGTSYNLSSLSASTVYNYQLRTNCASGSSAYSATANFTTLADAGGCSDIYEPNDALATPKPIPVGTPIQAIISSQTDKDYFSFENTTNSNNIRVTLSNLPKNYNIALFNPSGGRAGASSNTGTADDIIIYNTTTRIGTYVIEVVGFNKLFSPDCYSLLVETSGNTFRTEENSRLIAKEAFGMYPQPATGIVNLQFARDWKGLADLAITNQTGAKVMAKMVNLENGQAKIDVSGLKPGMYYLRVSNGSQSVTQKLLVQR